MIQHNKFFLGVSQSALGQAWFDSLDRDDTNKALTISQKFGLNALLARILAARSVEEEDAVDYLTPTLKKLMPNPTKFVDMEKAAARLVKAIENKEQVAIFGDYDVDLFN